MLKPAKNSILARLQEILTEQKSRNPSLGVRALARRLDIPAPTLSRLLSGRRGLTLAMAQKIVDGLTELPAERRRLMKAFAVDSQRSAATATRYRHLELHELERLSDWGHGALLEVLRGEKGVRSLYTLSLATGLPEPEVERLLRNLRDLKLVTHSIKQGWQAREVHLSSIRWEGEAPWKKVHRGYAERAIKYFDRYEKQEATFQGITFLASATRIEEAKTRIREFAEELADELAQESGDALYRLNVQLFPLGKKR